MLNMGLLTGFCRIKETLPEEVTQKMHAPPQDTSVPFATPETMTQYDAFVRPPCDPQHPNKNQTSLSNPSTGFLSVFLTPC